MKPLHVVLPLGLGLLLAALPLRAQTLTRETIPRVPRPLRAAAAASHAPLSPGAYTPPGPGEAAAEPRARRSWWAYPATGAVVGAVVGGVWGTYSASRMDYLGPPPYLATAPLGAAVGFLAGVVANGVHPR